MSFSEGVCKQLWLPQIHVLHATAVICGLFGSFCVWSADGVSQWDTGKYGSSLVLNLASTLLPSHSAYRAAALHILAFCQVFHSKDSQHCHYRWHRRRRKDNKDWPKRGKDDKGREKRILR